ncbi:MgtC/SapB family protein [Candidatus Woesearchaeota archaeon]|nr:MgtC/SapB family protein [Candidatus Woesearchaeota archaeon]
MDPFVFIGRFITVFFFALLFGYERQRAHKPIGFGTYLFVSLGACALALAAITLNHDNPLPLLSAIVTGIGFLGAGALIRSGDRITGFTSAASIWVFAIIGLVIGVGDLLIGILLYIGVWTVVLIDRRLKELGIGSYQKNIAISSNKAVDDDELRKALGTHRFKAVLMEVDKEKNSIIIKLVVEGGKEFINQLPTRLLKREWVTGFKIE